MSWAEEENVSNRNRGLEQMFKDQAAPLLIVFGKELAVSVTLKCRVDTRSGSEMLAVLKVHGCLSKKGPS